MAKHKFETTRGRTAKQGRQSEAAQGVQHDGHDKASPGVSKVPDKEGAKIEGSGYGSAHSTQRLPLNKAAIDQERAQQQVRNQVAIALLQSWDDEGDIEEERASWEAFKHGLDEDRLSDRKFFAGQ